MVEISCKQKILGKMNLLTNTEIKIAKYVLEHYEEMLGSNITELAEHAKVSDASVVRFCKSLGYKGYSDFKINAARDVVPQEKLFNPSLEESDDIFTICKKTFGSEISVLERTLASLDIQTLERAAQIIAQAEKVVLFGRGGNLLVGKDAQHKFLKIGVQVCVYDDVEMQLMSSSLMGENDAAICICHTGNSCHVMNCLKNAADNGAATIALVNQSKTPISKSADIVLYTACEKTIFQSESVSTRIAQLAVIDTLVAITALKNYQNSYQAVQRTRRAVLQHK